MGNGILNTDTNHNIISINTHNVVNGKQNANKTSYKRC